MIEVLDAMIRNHSRLAAKFKREGSFGLNRYHHGFAEGLKMAKRIKEAENVKD